MSQMAGRCKLRQKIGAVILLAIVPISLLISSVVQESVQSDIDKKLAEYAQRTNHFIDRESLEAEIYLQAFSATIIADEHGGIVHATPAACQLFQYTLAELKKMRINDLMPARLRGQHNVKFAARAKEPYDPDKIVTVPQCEGVRKDGSEISIEVRTRVIKPENKLLFLARFTETKHIETVPTEKP